MNGRKERIEWLLERYFEARTTSEEERELRESLGGSEQADPALRRARMMFEGFGELARETLPCPSARRPERESGPASEAVHAPAGESSAARPERDGAPRPGKVGKGRAAAAPASGDGFGERSRMRRTVRRRVLWCTAGAVAASVVLGLVFRSEPPQPYCYIDGEAIYDAEIAMQTTAYLRGFAKFGDPQRMVDELIDNE